MRHHRFAAWVAAAGLALAVLGGGPVAPAAEEPESSMNPLALLEAVPVPTTGGMQFWADELFFREWRIQRNATGGHYRLLDGNYLRHASGTYEECLAKLDEIKQKRELPPMEGKAVLVLHGLARTRNSTYLLAKYLDYASDYVVFNVGYPSTRQTISDHARSLANIVDNLHGIEEINFVGQSLGNIVIRHYLADAVREGGRGLDPRIKRFVMLGPPNHGSIAATSFADNKLFCLTRHQ